MSANALAFLTSEWCRHIGRPSVITPLGRLWKSLHPLSLRDFIKGA